MIDFSSLKKALGTYSSNLKKLRDDIEVLERTIEDVMFAPASKTDARAALHAFVDAQQADFRAGLTDSLKDLSTNSIFLSNPAKLAERMRLQPLPTAGLPSLEYRRGMVDASSLQRTLCGVFGEAIKKSLSDALDAVDWPPGGILEADRQERLRHLQTEMARLKTEEQRMVQAAQDLNFNVEGVE